MATAQISRHCKSCDRRTLHAKETFSVVWGIVLSVLSGGLFLLLWVPLLIIQSGKPYRCQTCGRGRRT